MAPTAGRNADKEIAEGPRMTFWPHTRLACVIGFLVISTASATQAEVIRLEHPGGRYGHGWLFFDLDRTCKIVTAAHILRGDGGPLRTPPGTDRRNRQSPTARPRILSPELDVALMEMRGALADGGCTMSRLGDDHIGARLTSAREAFLETTIEGEFRTIRVERRASTQDDQGGKLVVYAPVWPGDRIVQGMSGSAILDADGVPLALVTETVPHANLARAVRFDVVKALVRSAAAPAQNPRGAPANPAAATWRPQIAGLTVEAGKIGDANAGLDQLIGEGQAARRSVLKPDRGTVVLVLRLGVSTQITEVGVSVADEAVGVLHGMHVATIAGHRGRDSNWIEVRYCAASSGSADLACRFVPRTVDWIRLVLKSVPDRELALRAISVK